MAIDTGGMGLLSSYNNAISGIGNASDTLVTDANTLINSESMTTDNMLVQLQSMYEQQERVSLTSQMIKSLHDMNQQVIQTLK